MKLFLQRLQQKHGRPRGKNTICFKYTKKDTIFSQKSLKAYYIWPAKASKGRGAKAPLVPVRTPINKNKNNGGGVINKNKFNENHLTVIIVIVIKVVVIK